MLEAAYSVLHWGDDASGEQDVYVASGYGEPVAELAAISYVATKAGKAEVFIHHFSKVNGRGPYLLELVKSGKQTKYRMPEIGSVRKTVAMGPVIDMHTVDGISIFAPMVVICSTEYSAGKQGGPVLLASRFPVNYAIERRQNRPFIREHGIIH